MPLYEYRCLKCKRRTEKIERLQGPHLKKCPECGGEVERVPSAPAIQFKGSGWYVTDYAHKSSGGDSAGKSEKSEDNSSAKSEKADSKPAKPAKETKKSGAKEK